MAAQALFIPPLFQQKEIPIVLLRNEISIQETALFASHGLQQSALPHLPEKVRPLTRFHGVRHIVYDASLFHF